MDKICKKFIKQVKKENDIVELCIDNGWDAMYSKSTYVRCNFKGDELVIKRSLKNLIIKYKKFDRKIIKELEKKINKYINNNKISAFGLSQKIVNMTYKFLYCYKESITFSIDFKGCDCPLDSIIIDSLKVDENLCRTWTKINEKDYIRYQDIIKSKLLKKTGSMVKETGNLAYDFLNWD